MLHVMAVCDGDATAVGAGGTGAITYQWDAPGGLGTAATTTSTLCAGTAGVTVTDANGCTETGSVVIAEPTVLTVTTTAVDASCNGVCDGDVTSAGAGGTAPYTYSWSVLGAGQNQIGSVCAATYTVTVTDAEGCTATETATVGEPPVLTVTAAAVDASCSGVCDGDVTSAGAGGTAPNNLLMECIRSRSKSIRNCMCRNLHSNSNGCKRMYSNSNMQR